MFSGNFLETDLKEIPIEDTTSDAFHSLLWFIYTGEIKFKDDNDVKYAIDVYHLSDRYELLRLRQRVVEHLVSKVNPKDLIPISRVVFTLNNEDFESKVMQFIELNVEKVIELSLEELKELNDLTKDRLLDVLISVGFGDPHNWKQFVFKNKSFFVKKDVLFNNGIKCYGNPFDSVVIKKASFNAIKTFFGFVYFEKLILKDMEDFKVIREVCYLFISKFRCQSFFDCVENHLKHRITFENLETISGIAFEFKIKGLIKSINEFIEQNFTEILAKSDEQLCKMDDSTHHSLLLIISKKYRKCLQNDVCFKEILFYLFNLLLILL